VSDSPSTIRGFIFAQVDKKIGFPVRTDTIRPSPITNNSLCVARRDAVFRAIRKLLDERKVRAVGIQPRRELILFTNQYSTEADGLPHFQMSCPNPFVKVVG
jgi:hypothetical protein